MASGKDARLMPLLEQGAGAVSKVAGLVFAFHRREDRVLAEMGRPAMPMIELRLAWGPQRAVNLWRFLCRTVRPFRRAARAAGKVYAARMPGLPWMAEVHLPGFLTLSADEALRLDRFEPQLGLRILRHQLQRN